MIRRGLTLMLALALAQSANALQPFSPDAVEQLRDRYRGETVLVLLWSLGCHHCKDGMVRAAALRARHPGLNLVLINVDPPNEAPEVERLLGVLALTAADNWQFIDIPAARLRAALDPQWYGELPRSYLIEADGSAHGFSGRVPQDILEYWRDRTSVVDSGE